MAAPTRPRASRLLLLEVLLVVLLLGLAMVLYWRPAAAGLTDVRAWHWMVLASLLFGILGLRWRRRHRASRAALREVLEREAGGSRAQRD